jgi:Flp pilus assembly pilin Flp
MQHSNRVRALDERAQTMTEYAVVLTMITLAVVLAVAFLSSSIGSHITDLANLIK